MSAPDLSREEAEKAFEKFEPGFYGSGNTYTDRRTVWLAAWHRGRAAAIEEAAKKVESYSHSYFDSAANKLVVIDLKPIATGIRTLSQQEDGK